MIWCLIVAVLALIGAVYVAALVAGVAVYALICRPTSRKPIQVVKTRLPPEDP